ncbi:DDB1- and CUL4-associated factor [Echinococcus granulosus]|uniref:DDB1-and CUL4-associated factor n=1 Tax=Echinococcus granulosus TaxID=6210 RepID=W6V3D0_ECHGR|nr:DDB1- and CUL4-associated factor [Echinococcus granulosus]EUB60534.1 DDB1- and CUL4-associated factor [Echinococcus granulosus]
MVNLISAYLEQDSIQPVEYQGSFRGVYRTNLSSLEDWNILHDLQRRELRNGRLSDLGLSYLSKQFVLNPPLYFLPLFPLVRRVPNSVLWVLSAVHDAYCGIFDKTGDRFFSASVKNRVSIFDYTGRYLRLNRVVECKNGFGGITSMVQSPDQRQLALASDSYGLYLIDLDSDAGAAAVKILPGIDRHPVYSLAYCGTSNTEIIYGTSGSRVSLFDIVTGTLKGTYATQTSAVDVKAVAWLQDGDFAFLAGSDDTCIWKYDSRQVHAGPVAVYPGHLDGVTYIDSKNDGRYFLSNSKDQTVRLWDVRSSAPVNEERRVKPVYEWDYTIDRVPRIYQNPEVEGAKSKALLTLRGHTVLYNQIRAKFSPLHSTGQQFAYSGSADGDWVVWDLTTGVKLPQNRVNLAVVRDVAWHPWEPVLITSSVNGSLTCWNFRLPDEPQLSPVLLTPRHLDASPLSLSLKNSEYAEREAEVDESVRFCHSEAGQQDSVIQLSAAGFHYRFPTSTPTGSSSGSEVIPWRDIESDDDASREEREHKKVNLTWHFMSSINVKALAARMTDNTLPKEDEWGEGRRLTLFARSHLDYIVMRQAFPEHRRHLCPRPTSPPGLSAGPLTRSQTRLSAQQQRQHEEGEVDVDK